MRYGRAPNNKTNKLTLQKFEYILQELKVVGCMTTAQPRHLNDLISQ